ncbi:MAG: S41 family peptidase [bacterium]|nr:S41 family peptidase [bacterium]
MMTNRNQFFAAWVLFCLLALNPPSMLCVADDATVGYYRHPALHQDTLVFVAEGDLWSVGIEGGQARRLTSHPGEESHPVISPDGTTVAFAASYEGPTEVYTMPLRGGQPRRQTVEAEDSLPVAWTPSGKLVYTTQHFSTLPANQLVELDLTNQTRTRIPLSQASDATFDNRETIYFVRPRFHQQEVKRYQGGTARNIWRFSSADGEAQLLTQELPGEAHNPMWHAGRLYFITDSDGTMNIWSMNRKGKKLEQHTRHSGWDVKSASLHNNRIAYRVGGDLWLLELDSGETRRIPITLVSDFDHLREKWIDAPVDAISSAHIHPRGKEVAIVARGRLFVAPAKQGRWVHVQRQPGLRFRDTRYLPQSEELLALSDESDEFEFWRIPPRDVEQASQLTSGDAILKRTGFPSPDEKWLAYPDKNQDLWLVGLHGQDRRKISLNREGVGEVCWSPDSRWLVFEQTAQNTYQQLFLYCLETGDLTALTSDRVNSSHPAWSQDGNWLYFLSDRDLQAEGQGPWGLRQPEPYLDRITKLYRMALREGLRSPFRPDDELQQAESDQEDAKDHNQPAKTDPQDASSTETQVEDADADVAKTGEDKDAALQEPIQIDLQGIQHRVKALPVKRGNYSSLSATETALFWLDRDGDETRLMALKIDSSGTEPVQVADKIRDYEISADHKSMLIRTARSLHIVEAKPMAAKLDEGQVDLGPWQFSISVREDWRQIFVDAWRLHRDYFYDPDMHGVNWKHIRAKYEPLVERIMSRRELDDLIGQMVAELSALHTRVSGGDKRDGNDSISVPTLGARLKRDVNAGGDVIDYIYQADPDYPSFQSPLADPDLQIRQGDILLKIDGVSVLSVPDPHLLLRGKQERQVLLELQKPGQEQTYKAIVMPMTREADLRYHDWEYTRRLRVEEQGQGKLGYVHLRAMGRGNLDEWYRNFYPVFQRQGLIIDVRHNRGGNIDSIILEKLMRKAWFYWKGRVGEPYWNMQYAFRGHMVVLCDEHTASDGEAFAEGFRRLGLGKVIGTRTWGGEIWLTSSNRLSDGGIATAAEFGVYGPEREWLIEGHGVVPDILVDNLPHATFEGQDAQLEAAIQHLQQLIAEDPRPVPEPPEYPNKSFNYP